MRGVVLVVLVVMVVVLVSRVVSGALREGARGVGASPARGRRWDVLCRTTPRRGQRGGAGWRSGGGSRPCPSQDPSHVQVTSDSGRVTYGSRPCHVRATSMSRPSSWDVILWESSVCISSVPGVTASTETPPKRADPTTGGNVRVTSE